MARPPFIDAHAYSRDRDRPCGPWPQMAGKASIAGACIVTDHRAAAAAWHWSAERLASSGANARCVYRLELPL